MCLRHYGSTYVMNGKLLPVMLYFYIALVVSPCQLHVPMMLYFFGCSSSEHLPSTCDIIFLSCSSCQPLAIACDVLYFLVSQVLNTCPLSMMSLFIYMLLLLISMLIAN